MPLSFCPTVFSVCDADGLYSNVGALPRKYLLLPARTRQWGSQDGSGSERGLILDAAVHPAAKSVGVRTMGPDGLC